jgi:hypothetical protein
MTESSHFTAGSALLEFLAGRLGAPGCWPEEARATRVPAGIPDEGTSLERWETEGGRTIAAMAHAP